MGVIRNIKGRVFAFLLSCFLAFGAVSCDYLEVRAMEWVGITVGFDTALKFLLGLLGVSIGGAALSEIDWSETREQCIEFQQNQGNSAVAVSQWWADVIKGKLDTASSVWSSFKEWASSLFVFSSDFSSTFSGIGNIYNNIYNTSYNFDLSGFSDLEVYAFTMDKNYIYMIVDSGTYNLVYRNDYYYSVSNGLVLVNKFYVFHISNYY